MKKLSLTLLLALATFCAYAQDAALKPFAQDALSYDSGKSTAWYFEAYGVGMKNPQFVEEQILSVATDKKLSHEALRLCCKLLKNAASAKSIKPMEALLNAGVDPTLPAEVLLALSSDEADAALKSAARKSGASNRALLETAITTFGVRQAESNLDFLSETLISKDAQIERLSIFAIAQIRSAKSVGILSAHAAAGVSSENKVAIYDALSILANFMLAAGDNDAVLAALKPVPADFAASIFVRANLLDADARTAYFDKLIIGGGDLAKVAGRAANTGRTFENSAALIAAYPKLEDALKMIAINSFMLTKDPRFYDVFKADIDSSDTELRRTAVFASLFTASNNEAAVKKLVSILKDGDKNIALIAEGVLIAMPGDTVDKVLQNDVSQKKILALRGSKEHVRSIWKEFFADIKKKETEALAEQTLMWHDLKDFAANYLNYADEERRMIITRIIVKKIATMKDPAIMQAIAVDALSGNLSPEDPSAKLIAGKLKISLDSIPVVKTKQVWQKKYFSRAVDDNSMKIATLPAPLADGEGFVSLFNGKDLSGWKVEGGSAKFSAENGDILGICDPASKRNTFLVTEKNYKDFIFTCEFKWDVNGNSGIMVRAELGEKGSVRGPQVEFDSDSERRWTGGIYGEGLPTAWKYSLSREDQEPARSAVKLDSWNTLIVECKGGVYRTWINGVPIADLNWPEWDKAGFFGLQIHAGKQGQVRWRNIKIKEL